MSRKKFVFSLDRVLRLRHHETEQAQQALHAATSARTAQEQHVADAAKRLQQTRAAGPSGPLEPWRLRQHDAHCRALQQAHDQARRELVRLLEAEATARRRVHEKHQAEESLVVLRDAQAAEHRKAAAEHELKFLDEQAITGYHRNRQLS